MFDLFSLSLFFFKANIKGAVTSNTPFVKPLVINICQSPPEIICTLAQWHQTGYLWMHYSCVGIPRLSQETEQYEMLKQWPSLQSRHLKAGVIHSPACSLSVQQKDQLVIIVLVFPIVLVSVATCISLWTWCPHAETLILLRRVDPLTCSIWSGLTEGNRQYTENFLPRRDKVVLLREKKKD